ncbi:related to SLS1 protein precursor [Rhynchosporium secalis]|uniref:Nucleotide exchange factor SIL1 n=1 Tax=Rhynchosporium secalis TaxID=38038 RepID=A0A1E1M984_RHYSE|nr:related to SLS1 protein precursor [Rhynchosporium secalis]
MVQLPARSILGLVCLSLPILARALSSPPAGSPVADSHLICSTTNSTDCYPKVFEPTKDFQPIREGQDLPPGLHVRMNIWSGEKEARLNLPMEGEGGAIDGVLEIPADQLPTEQSIIVVPQPEDSEPKPVIPKDAPVYEAAGKITPPSPSGSGEEITTFQNAMTSIQTEARAFDSSLDDLRDLSHDIYYGLEITKDRPVLEKLVCLTLGYDTEKILARENGRDHKAANIIASSIQNNPTALKEVGDFWKMVMYPSCGAAEQSEVKSGNVGEKGIPNFVSMFRARLGKETDVGALKAKVMAISGLIKEPLIKNEFLEKGGMELLLAIFLKKGEEFDSVKMKVAELVSDNFLDEGMGAELGVWPKMPRSEAKVCEIKDRMLEDGCWEAHVEAFVKERMVDEKQSQEWAGDLLKSLGRQRTKFGDSIKDREL